MKKKESDLDNPASYRTISLINAISRILEKIINQRIMNWTEKRNLININKFHSTQDNILKIAESCKVGIQDGFKCGIVLFDIEKAFDRAPHKKILERLVKYRSPSLIGKWLCSFLSDRKFQVAINSKISDKKNIKAGTPQGSPLSPILFSLLINDIGKVLHKHDILYALFADDLVIWKIGSRIDHIEKALQKATFI